MLDDKKALALPNAYFITDIAALLAKQYSGDHNSETVLFKM